MKNNGRNHLSAFRMIKNLVDNTMNGLSKARGSSVLPVKTRTNQGIISREDVRSAYRMILGREAENEGVIDYHATNKDLQTLRRAFMVSREFGAANADLLAQLPSVMNFRSEWSVTTSKYYQDIDRAQLSLQRVSAMYADARIDDEYLRGHLRRFHELFAFLASRLRSLGGARILEIGTSAHTLPFYKEFFACECDSVCRPANLGGPSPEWAHEHGSTNHWEIDLSHFEDYPVDQIPERHYDAVVCCEVIEHLTRAPREIIRIALSKLKSSGFLYLTTPNFLTPANTRRLFSGLSPVPDFVSYNNNYHAHHHFREYSALELTEEVLAGGGRIELLAFSHYWDQREYTSPDEAMHRSGLVIVIRPT